MKKLAASLMVVTIVCLGVGVSASLEAPPKDIVTGGSLTTSVDPNALPFATINFTPTYCGERCLEEGASIGCIDQSSYPPRRTFCTCCNGWLTCC